MQEVLASEPLKRCANLWNTSSGGNLGLLSPCGVPFLVLSIAGDLIPSPKNGTQINLRRGRRRCLTERKLKRPSNRDFTLETIAFGGTTGWALVLWEIIKVEGTCIAISLFLTFGKVITGIFRISMNLPLSTKFLISYIFLSTTTLMSKMKPFVSA